MQIVLLGLALAAGSTAAVAPPSPETLETYPDASGMPADVRDFIIRWHDCVHWLGEEPYDEPRQRQIARAVSRVCAGIDAAGRKVRRRHADDPAVLSRIADYEELGL